MIDPPAYAISRRALEDYRSGDYVLRQGTIVLVLPWLQQRDARWWPHALRSGSLGW
jgi:cytochrome P450